MEQKILGEEKISKLLLKFSIPCVTALLISALYNIVDQIFIGNSELGIIGNAATGISFPIICIANAFAWCIGDGAASYLSICQGKKDAYSSHKCVGNGILVTTIISIVLMIICYIFASPLMIAFGASSESYKLALDYFQIIVAFFPFYLLLNVTNSMIRADGSPTYAMIAMLVGAVINLILDPLFIYVFKFGIKGAAYATGIGQVISCYMCIRYFKNPKSFRLSKDSFKLDYNILKETIKLGLSTFIFQISIAVMTVMCNITLKQYSGLSKYGEDIPLSVFSIQTKVYTIVCNIVTGIVLGGQPIFGYNYGANKMDRVKKTYKIVLLLTVLIGIISTMIFQFCPQIIINLFGGGDKLYLEFAIKTFRIYLSLLTITCLVKMTSVFFQSIGKSFYAVISAIIRDLLLFTPLVIILPKYLEQKNPGTGIYGLLYAAPIADFIVLFVILFLTIRFFKKQESK